MTLKDRKTAMAPQKSLQRAMPEMPPRNSVGDGDAGAVVDVDAVRDPALLPAKQAGRRLRRNSRISHANR
jgi:hypothetical protein